MRRHNREGYEICVFRPASWRRPGPPRARSMRAQGRARRRGAREGRKDSRGFTRRGEGEGVAQAQFRLSAGCWGGGEGEAKEGAILAVLCRERRGAGRGAATVLAACPVGGWLPRRAACNRGRGVRALSPFSAAWPSPNRAAAVPRAAASSRSPFPPRCLPAAPSRCLGGPGFLRGLGSQAASGGPGRLWRGAASPPGPPRSPARRAWARSPLPGWCRAVCSRAAAGRAAKRFPRLGALGSGPALSGPGCRARSHHPGAAVTPRLLKLILKEIRTRYGPPSDSPVLILAQF